MCPFSSQNTRIIKKFLPLRQGGVIKEQPTLQNFGAYINTLLTVLNQIKIIPTSQLIGGGVANAETRAAQQGFPGYVNPPKTKINPADITLAREARVPSKQSEKSQPKKQRVIPTASSTVREYDTLFDKRVFTILHELTHSALGTKDETESLNIGAKKAVTQATVGKVKRQYANYAINADSWALAIIQIRDALLERQQAALLEQQQYELDLTRLSSDFS